MIVFGAVTLNMDTGVGEQLVIGGVALISIILTAYTGFATYEDIKRQTLETNEHDEH